MEWWGGHTLRRAPDAPACSLEWCSGLPSQPMPEDLDGCCDFPDARVHSWATDEVAGTGRRASP